MWRLHDTRKIQLAIEKGSNDQAITDGCRDGTKLTNISSVATPSLSNSPVNDASQEIEKLVAACSASCSPGIV